MASWKKIIVSGSSPEFAALQVDNLTSGQVVIGGGSTGDLTTTAINGTGDIVASSGATDVSMTGSFTGSFAGDGSGLTGIVASNINLADLTQGEGISTFTYNGSAPVSISVSGAAQLSDNAITKWNDTDGKFVNSSLTDNGTVLSGTSSIQLTGASSILTGSFTGSFVGDGSGLTGLATTLSGSTNSGNFEVNLLTQTLTVQGTANEVETSATGQTITIGLPDNVTIAGDLAVNGGDITTTASTFNLVNATATTVNLAGGASAVNIGATTSITTVKDDLVVEGDLTVNGDLTYLNVANLYVEDKFILLNSGSTGASDGGVVIAQSGTEGKAFTYDSATDRWGFTGSLAGDATSVAPDAFVATVIDKNVAESVDVAAYQKPGNIRIETDGEIYIWS
jgi:phage baseplate assembly protein gpV